MTPRTVMKAEIVVDYDVKSDEFGELKIIYPTGVYYKCDNDIVHWFRLTIGDNLELTWFRSWRD